ncbi:DUF2529 domain-containing protein [Peribacillus asahii]|uniref:DUF2529 domain-containing protein n=1 Tax=Peribacillus asahii TaxID=228899 RepID=UPI0020792CC5|nr:DUF2529 domain-containing protein [Peribacillus asahii]USK59691.1 DUF2529 domain-containing protein [Peribacillus asahii]
MLKIFSTQINGLFKKMIDHEEFNIEDAARLLAQAVIGEGSIYIYGFEEMDGITKEALNGVEPLPAAKVYYLDEPLTLGSEDRFLLFSRFSNDPEAIRLSQRLQQADIPFVAVSTVVEAEGDSLATLADVHIDLRVQRGLIPDELGNRVGYPTLLIALFAYYGIKFTIEEILQEYQ